MLVVSKKVTGSKAAIGMSAVLATINGTAAATLLMPGYETTWAAWVCGIQATFFVLLLWVVEAD